MRPPRVGLPAWLVTIRMRMALVSAAVSLVVAVVLVGGVNLALSQVLGATGSGSQVVIESDLLSELGLPLRIRLEDVLGDAEAQARAQALADLRTISVAALAMLVPVSFLVSWLVAGRALRPVDRITAVARDIEATDLSRRIHLDGPDDELRRLADTFDAMLDRIDRGVRAQRALVEDASHELRNPLAVVRTNLDVALADPSDADGLRDAAEVVRRAADRMSGTVDDLLAALRDERGRHPVAVPLDLGFLAMETGVEFEAPAAERGCAVVYRVKPGLALVADAGALKRALANLLQNALRAAPAGSTVTVGAGRVDGWLWLGVRDHGPGIPAELQPDVFRRTWHDGGVGAPGEARGIGLALTRQIAEAHGGRVSVTSAPGAGASFVVWLPDRAAPERLPLGSIADPLWQAGWSPVTSVSAGDATAATPAAHPPVPGTASPDAVQSAAPTATAGGLYPALTTDTRPT